MLKSPSVIAQKDSSFPLLDSLSLTRAMEKRAEGATGTQK